VTRKKPEPKTEVKTKIKIGEVLPPTTDLERGAFALAKGILPDPRDERMAQLLAAGSSQAAAYRGAGFSPSKKSGAVKARQPHIIARVRQIQEVALQATQLDVRRVVDEFSKIAFANMLDYTKVDDDGNLLLDMKQMTREQAAAIGEVTQDRLVRSNRDGTSEVTYKTKFKLHDKQTALTQLGRYMGMFKEDNERNLNFRGVVFHVSADDANL
jgi:phage terminase small subunit